MAAGRERSVEKPNAREGHKRGPADATIRSVLVTALGTYRRRFGAIALAAVVIFVPVDLLLLPITAFWERFADAHDAKGLAFLAAGATIAILTSLIGTTIFAGVIEAFAAADQEGSETPVLVALRRRPMVRLILGAVVVAVLVFVGAFLFFVPGFILLVLLAIVGPLIAGERIGVWAAMRRSASLVWRHFLLVTVTVTIPFLLEGAPVRLLERYVQFDSPLISVSLDVLTSVFLGALVGVLEVTVVHALLAEEGQRHAAGAVIEGVPCE
jgi:hypothetical protein